MLAQQSFLELWARLFPAHDPLTLRFTPASKAESYWNSPSWKKAARDYHSNLNGCTLAAEPDPNKLKLLRLMDPGVSLERAWNELNDPRNRPTPAVTVEAVWVAVRERGLGALEEPATKARLDACDTAARAEIDRRIVGHFGGQG